MLVEAEDLRIDVDGVPAVDGLSFSLERPHAFVLGAPRALYEALAGTRPVARGRLLVSGEVPADAARAQTLAAVPASVPVPPGWTTTEYVTWNARLAGATRKDAEARAEAAVAKMKLADVARARLDRAPLAARRAAFVAAALATGAKTFLLEDPLVAMPEDVADAFADVLCEALDEHAWMVFVSSRPPITSAVVRRADEAVAIAGAHVEMLVPPEPTTEPTRHFTARLARRGARFGEFAAHVAAKGGMAEIHGARVLLDLGETLTTAEVVRLALDAELVLLELLPTGRSSA